MKVKDQKVTISRFVPYLTSSADACQRESDCSLQSGHPGECYPIGFLYEPTRAHIAARRERPAEHKP